MPCQVILYAFHLFDGLNGDALIVMREDIAIRVAYFGHAVGTVLAQADTMPVADGREDDTVSVCFRGKIRRA